MSNHKQFSNAPSCLGIVLAGGLSSRMGTDKAKLVRNNKDMVSFSQQLLEKVGIKQSIVSGNQYEVNDIVANAGPLGGIFSVLQTFQPKSILVLPVDLPLMTPDLLNTLKVAGELSQKACFYQNHYLPLYLPNNAYVELFLTKAFHNFSQGSGKGPSMRALLEKVPHKALTPNDEKALFNTNTPEQWQQAKSVFTQQRSSHV